MVLPIVCKGLSDHYLSAYKPSLYWNVSFSTCWANAASRVVIEKMRKSKILFTIPHLSLLLFLHILESLIFKSILSSTNLTNYLNNTLLRKIKICRENCGESNRPPPCPVDGNSRYSTNWLPIALLRSLANF